MSLDLSKADDKLATLDMTLKADSGFRSNTKGDRISANQWGHIVAITEDGPAYREMKAAADLIAALEAICAEADRMSMTMRRRAIFDAGRAAIAKALGRTPNEIGEEG